LARSFWASSYTSSGFINSGFANTPIMTLLRSLSDLQMLLRRGYGGGLVWFEDTSVNRSLYFRKHITETGDFGVMMEIPRPSLSSDEDAALKQLLSRIPDAGRRPLAVESGTDDVLRVDFGRDMDAATQMAASVFTTVFRSAELRVRVWARDICPLDELVSSRDHPRPLEIWRLKLWKKTGVR
jgi:hypothetical protein